MKSTSDTRFLIRRRSVLAGLAAGASLAACGPQVDDAGTPRRIAREVDQTLQSIAMTELAADPELATRLGLSEDAVGYPFNRYLTDRSQAAYERRRVSRLEILEVLAATPALPRAARRPATSIRSLPPMRPPNPCSSPVTARRVWVSPIPMSWIICAAPISTCRTF